MYSVRRIKLRVGRLFLFLPHKNKLQLSYYDIFSLLERVRLLVNAQRERVFSVSLAVVALHVVVNVNKAAGINFNKFFKR